MFQTNSPLKSEIKSSHKNLRKVREYHIQRLYTYLKKNRFFAVQTGPKFCGTVAIHDNARPLLSVFEIFTS